MRQRQLLPLGVRSIACVFTNLGGLWTFERHVTSHLGCQPTITATGEVRMLPQGPHAWAYQETGKVVVAGAPHPCRQSYRYERDAQTGALRVFFGQGEHKGRHFHDLAMSDDPGHVQHARGLHLCGPDRYEVDYLFDLTGAPRDTWLVTYRVRGPRKRYIARTRLYRASLSAT